MMRVSQFIRQWLPVVLCCMAYAASGQGTMLLRQPAISGQSIVFVHGDDLWVTGSQGGDARRLTSAVGAENNPRISADGKWVAFSGQYDGNTDVYIIPIDGGEPRRLTWHPGADIVQGWSADGKWVYFTSGREATPIATSKFYRVGIGGGTPEPLVIPFASAGSFSPDEQFLAYQPFPLIDAEWRNYRGGQALPIWIYNMKSGETSKTPQSDRERQTSPVWDGGMLYFLSELDFANNVWSYNPKTKALKQLTFFSNFDVKNISASKGTLVMEQGGYLHTLDLASGKLKQLDVEVKGDLNWGRARWSNVPAAALTNPGISPTGKRAVFEYRGDIFTVPKENGDWRNITRSPGVADRYPTWSPDGQKIAWFSDQSGEYQLMVGDQDGMEKPRAYPIPNKKFYYFSWWSPDSKYIAFTDTDYNLWNLELATGSLKLVATDKLAHPNRTMQPAWSPDSKWISYAQIQENQFKAVKIYNVETGKSTQLTDGLSDAISPVWDANGKYLYFLASTDYGLGTGWLDMSSYNIPVTRSLYIAVLAKETPSPFEPRSDEEPAKPGAEKPLLITKTTGDTVKTIPAKPSGITVKVDLEGLSQRIVAAEVPARNYTSMLAAAEGYVFYGEAPVNQPGGLVLHRYNLKDRKSEPFVSGVSWYDVSADRKNLLYQNGSSWCIVSTVGPPPKPGDGKLATDNIKIYVDPAKEAEQIYREGWRFQRDFLYVNNEHGAPWDKVYEWYKPWLAHVRHRSDLNYIIDILGGEISIGHSFTSGGDYPATNPVPGGLLGADYDLDKGFFRIRKIYNGENWNPDLRSPLSGPGVNVKEGDYLVEVEGRPLTADMNIYSLFEGTANRQIRIKVNSRPALEGARTITVVPIPNEAGLRSRNWVESNRRKVDELSGGKLAYVYVPNTSSPGYTYFNRYYFAQQDKKGVVIDERNNGGGSAADYMIDVMNRKLLGYFNNRVEGHKVSTTPMAGIWGPKVMIINQNAGSGGDLLPYMFKKSKIGPLVGTRTWGGLVGIWDTPAFIDGGTMTAPRGGFFDTNGEWAVEGTGVTPDIEVTQDPKTVIGGKDPQLDRAVQEALNLLPTQGIELKKEPAAPIRYKRPALRNVVGDR